jgi:hypothetical protein
MENMSVGRHLFLWEKLLTRALSFAQHSPIFLSLLCVQFNQPGSSFRVEKWGYMGERYMTQKCGLEYIYNQRGSRCWYNVALVENAETKRRCNSRTLITLNRYISKMPFLTLVWSKLLTNFYYRHWYGCTTQNSWQLSLCRHPSFILPCSRFLLNAWIWVNST